MLSPVLRVGTSQDAIKRAGSYLFSFGLQQRKPKVAVSDRCVCITRSDASPEVSTAGPHTPSLIELIWRGLQEFASLMSLGVVHGMVWGPHMENYCPKAQHRNDWIFLIYQVNSSA